MIDWQAAAEHMAALGIKDSVLLALFPPKGGRGREGCTYIEVSPGSRWEPNQVESQLSRRPGFSLGFIQNPGGTKNAEIKFCRSLFFEDDGAGSKEEKTRQWEEAGLPKPSLQVWTGGKSIHHYWLLDTPCTPLQFKQAQQRLFRYVKRQLPSAEIDTALCNAARILRLAGGIHPETGQRAEVVSAGGQRYSYEQLWNLTGDDNLPPTGEERVVLPSRPVRAEQVEQGALQPPVQRHPLPDYDTPEHKQFCELQLENDRIHNPELRGLKDFSRTRQLDTVVEALGFCPFRDVEGSNTYPVAFKLLCAIVNEYGPNDALECAQRANWSQENWDIVVEAQKIEENSDDRGLASRVSIYYLFDTAEFNGWIRPWKITKDRKAKEEDPEEAAENRVHNQRRIAEYIEASEDELTLAEVLPAEVASLLKGRAQAFPVNEVAMLPPFIAGMAAVMGTRYRVRVKKGWEEPMVFWLGSVGPASSIKTPVVNQVLHPLKEMDYREIQNYKQLLREYKSRAAEDRGEPPNPPRKLVAGDTTLEALCAALDYERNFGMISLHDELVSFIAQMDAYRGRGSGPSKDRAHWLSMWSGQEINIMRKGHDPIFIPETAVSLFGCVQQDKLSELLHGDDATAKSGDGFWARFLWCVPRNPLPEMNYDETEINEELAQLARAFDSFAGRRFVVGLSEEARELFRVQADQWSKQADATYAAKSAFLGKMRGYAARFAGFLHALDQAQRIVECGGGLMNAMPELIPGGTMERALRLSEFFINQFDTLAPQVGGNEEFPSWVTKVIELAKSREDRRVSVSDLRCRKWGSTGKERRKMLSDLVQVYGQGKLVEAKRANQVWWEYGASMVGVKEAA